MSDGLFMKGCWHERRLTCCDGLVVAFEKRSHFFFFRELRSPLWREVNGTCLCNACGKTMEAAAFIRTNVSAYPFSINVRTILSLLRSYSLISLFSLPTPSRHSVSSRSRTLLKLQGMRFSLDNDC